MARRAKTKFNPLHLTGILAVIIGLACAGYFFMRGSKSTGYTGVPSLNVSEYLDNSNALGNNTYQLEGIIEERLDNWRSADGRLFSVVPSSGGESPLPVFIPAKFNNTNVQRHQRFQFKVTIQAATGILEVIELTKA